MVDLQGLVTLISQTVTSPGDNQPQDMLDMFRIYDPGTVKHCNKSTIHQLTTMLATSSMVVSWWIVDFVRSEIHLDRALLMSCPFLTKHV